AHRDRDEERDCQFEERDPQRRRHASGIQHRAERREDARRRADEQRIHEPARGDFPPDENNNDNAQPDHPRVPEKETSRRLQAAFVFAGARGESRSTRSGLYLRGMGRTHPRRLPRASRCETTALSSATITTTKAI